MKKLLKIENFGAIDADTDDLLLDCFEDHEAYKELVDFKKFLVIGRKGSGKTSIFKKILMTKGENIFSLGHTFTDYPWHYHKLQAQIGIPDPDKYTHSWKYLILLTISKIILNQDHSLPYNEDTFENMEKIEKFVVDSYGTRDPDITQIFTPSKYLRLKPHFKIDFGLLGADISPEAVPMPKLHIIIQEVNRNLIEHVLSCLNPENKYYISFDQLDLGFGPEDKEYSNRLISLLLACRDLNIKAKEKAKKLFVAVFLRDDIYDNLHFEDKNKITENFVSLIEWDTPSTKKTLKGLMEKRFNKLLSENESEKIKWENVFDEKKEMSGHQTKYKHLIDRTYLRPRDIIKFCNLILNHYKDRIENEGEYDKNQLIDNVDINKIKIDYSNYFLNELDDEIHKHIPDYKIFFELFKSIGVRQFSIEEFISVYNERKDSLKSISNPKEILKAFFEFSIIGFYRAGGGGYGGSEYVFKYKEPKTQFDETSKKFQVHGGLVDVLGLKWYEKPKSTNPRS